MLHVHNFTYGVLTPVLGYIMSAMGAFLGLRCTTRARSFRGKARARWLLLAGVSIGTTGIWLMHFIAMLGFTIPGETITYNVPVTIFSLLVAVGIVCAGLMLVGFGQERWRSLLLGGVITGLGVAVMHYLGMAAMRVSSASSSAGMVIGGGSGATAESFLLPLILGITVVSFVLTATIALAPSPEEIRYDEALMHHIRNRSEAQPGRTPQT